MKIYCVQMDVAWENPAANWAQAHALLSESKPEPGSLVLLPEMFATGFSMNLDAVCEADDSPTEHFLSSTAAEFGIYLLAGVTRGGETSRGLNQCVVFSPEGRELSRYTKMQPFRLGGEADRYAAGPSPVLFNWQGIPVATFICYDLRFPELFRAAVLRGAKIFTVIASWPDTRLHHWVKLLQARAIENLAFVAGTNRIGSDPKYVHSGSSLLVNHHGHIVADAGSKAGVISAAVDIADLDTYRHNFPALEDIRPGIRLALQSLESA